MGLRARNIERLRDAEVDVLVVGGGINGAVAAACLSARGARVALVDRGDFGAGTSQESSNLAWGGIKYLENLELGLVRELCVSRNHLLRSFPSNVQEIRFLTVHERGFRHGRLKLFLGTLLYWLLGSLFTRRPRLFSRAALQAREPILALDASDGGFEYSDAFLHDNDARFVWGFVRTAMDHDCLAANYVACETATHDGRLWRARLRDVATGEPAFEVRAKALVNACGPWVDALNAELGTKTEHRHVFSKGIHLVVPRVTEHRRVLTFFADDGRLFFAIPMGPRTCIGTTDTRVDAPETRVTPEDRAFVLRNVNERLSLERPLDEGDVVAERCGVRPLVTRAGASAGEGQWFDLSRKHVVEIDAARAQVSVFGGKLTDCVNVGEEIFEAVRGLGVTPSAPRAAWYGEPPEETRREFFHKAALMRLDERTPAHARERLASRLWRRYGARAFPMLEAIREDPRMADAVIEGAEYLRCELEHTARHEMVVKLEDFLRRRSKISLVVRQEDIASAAGLGEACRIFFGDEAEARRAEYFRAPPRP